MRGKPFRWLVGIGLGLLVGGVVPARADNFALINNGYLDPQEIQLVGTALPAANGIALTTSANPFTAGALYLKQRVTSRFFRADFDFRITPGTPVGGEASADGFTFAIARSPAALGNAGPSLGYGGIDASSFAVEFDTFGNGPGFSDPDGNHIGIDLHGSTNSIATTSIPTALDDGLLHHVTVTYQDTIQGGHVTVALDGQLRMDVTDPQIDVPDGFFGFTAGNGAGTAQHEIDSFRLITTPPDSTLSASVRGGGRLGSTLSPPAHLSINVRTDVKARLKGKIQVWYLVHHGVRLRITPFAIVATPEGTATVYGAARHGAFSQLVRLDFRDLDTLDAVRLMLDDGSPSDRWQLIRGKLHIHVGRR